MKFHYHIQIKDPEERVRDEWAKTNSKEDKTRSLERRLLFAILYEGPKPTTFSTKRISRKDYDEKREMAIDTWNSKDYNPNKKV